MYCVLYLEKAYVGHGSGQKWRPGTGFCQRIRPGLQLTGSTRWKR